MIREGEVKMMSKVIGALALMVASLVPVSAWAEKITKHVVDDWEEWYWTKTVTVSHGEEHTFWITGLTPDTMITDMSVYCDYTYKEEGETYEDSVSASEFCEVENSSGGWDKYALLTADVWDYVPSSMSKLTFTIRVDGWGPEEGETVPAADMSFTFGHEKGSGSYPGEPEPVVVDPKGTETNPVTFSIVDANTVQNPGSVSWSPAETWEGGDVYLNTSSLTAGRKYVFGFENLAQEAMVTMSLKAGGDNLFTEENASTLFEECEGHCWAIVPETSGVYEIVVNDDSNDFTCDFAVYATRTPAQHEGVDYGDGDPGAHFGTIGVGETSESFVPGYLNHPKSGANDGVIDGKLFVLSGLVKNADYCFETEGASAPLLMRLYDAKGTVLAENLYVSDAGSNVRVTWTAPANISTATKYYIGVCEQLEEGQEPSGGEITLKVSEVEVEDVDESLDVIATTAGGNPFDAPGAVASEPQTFSKTSWTHTYAIAARSGVEYHLKAKLTAAGEDNGLALDACVYTLSGTTRKYLVKAGEGGAIDPATDADYLAFTPTANGTVYVDVSVAKNEKAWGAGQGLDYGPYSLCCVVSGNYGSLKVEMKGADEDSMGWKILKGPSIVASKEVFYPAGSSAILAAGTYTLVAKNVTGFATPATTGFGTFEVVAGQTKTVLYKYADTSDPKDDYPCGKSKDGKTTYAAVKLSPTARGVECIRSLWTDDRADWYSFSGTAGVYYRFAFTEKSGAPEVRVYKVKTTVKTVTGEADLEECAYSIYENPAECVQVAVAEKGNYYVKVAHADAAKPVDSSYNLFATSANPGIVKFAKTAISVSDAVGYVDLSVSRSGREGITRVDYKTVGEQSSAEDALYYPTRGTLVWNNGENAAKTIRVKIVPQEAGFAGTFQVKLTAVDPEDESFDKESEYPAVFAADTATVTVTASAKANPGTIQLADCATPNKPVVETKAAEDGKVVLKIARTSGTSGLVAVTLTTVDKTAKAGTDYAKNTQTLTWADGDAEPQDFVVSLDSSRDWTASKSFSVNLTAVSGKNYSKPTLAASSITVNIANDRYETTVAAFAKAFPQAGVAVKEAKTGTWFIKSDGSIFSSENNGKLTFTLTGPGVFTYRIEGEEERQLVVPYGETKKNTVVITGLQTLLYYTWKPMSEDAVALRQCVKYEYVVTSAVTKIASGKLPDGLKLAQDAKTKKYMISGTPTKAGYFYVKLANATGKVTEEVYYDVTAAGTAIGTFNGLATTFDTADGLRSLASVQLTATAQGKLTAKVMIGGKSQSFADTGYAAFDDSGDYTTVTAEIPLVLKVGSGKTAETVTNWLYCTVVDAPETDADGRVQEGSVQLMFAKLATAKANEYTDDVWYEGKLCRDNSKLTDWAAEAAAFAGYYTVSLANPDAQPGEPKGNGYLTLTVDAKGKVKIAGMLADGTAYSGSSLATYLVRRDDETALRIPLYACKGTSVFGGWLELKVRDGSEAPVVSYDAPDTDLVWKNDAATSTSEGEYGFSLYLYPVGGWYDTVKNLQRWFLDYDFSVDLPSWDDDFESLLPAGYETYAFAANPCGLAVDVLGDTVSVAKQVLVKDSVTKLNDFAASTNPSNVKFTFKRATGVLNGTFDLWYEGYNEKTKKTEQKSITGLKHNGVLLLSRGDDGYLEDDIWTSGFYLGPKIKCTDWTKSTATKTVTYDWIGSYRFDVKATKVDRDWSEVGQ